MKDDRHEQFADWITRYYSSHKYIPDGHSDGELIGKLIRCKDCKHKYIENKVWQCPFGLPGGPDFWCGYGVERKEE